jgi:hypothetical protein
MNELTQQPDGLHWACRYIGLPWQARAKGPDIFDCWSLVVWVQKQHFGRNLPDIPVAEGNLKRLALTFRDHPERKRWQLIETPEQGDAVLMRQSRHPIHVGIWITISPTEQGVLHCVKGPGKYSGGVVFQNLASLKLAGWHIEGFYRLSSSEAAEQK